MGKTRRNVDYAGYIRCPKFKHKLLAGDKKCDIVTNWDDKPIAARKESKYNKKNKKYGI